MSIIVKTKGGQYLVTVPIELVRALGINHGEKVAWKIISNKRVEMIWN
jgi:antitoxin component of MazEF toxin-antitoxin module